MRWGWWLRLGTVLLLVVGLSPAGTALARSPDVTVGGRLVTSDGTPVSGRRVAVTTELSGGNLALDPLLMMGVFPLMTCLTGEPLLEVCSKVGEAEHVTKTKQDGRFRIRLPAQDAYDTSGQQRDLTVVTGVPPEPGETNGASVSWHVEPEDPTVELPSVPVWSAGLRARSEDGVTTYKWRPLPRVPGATDTSTQFNVGDEKRGVGAGLSDPESPVRLDTRMLEDAEPTARLGGSARVDGVFVTWSAGTIETKAANPQPFSRGRKCLAAIGDRPESSHRDCWLFDGEFEAPLADTDSSGKGPLLGGRRPVDCGKERDDAFGYVECVRAPVSSVTVDLQRSRAIGDVVVRASFDHSWTYAAVDASTDRGSWRPIGRVSTGDELETDLEFDHQVFVLEAPADTTARYLRIRADDMPGPQDSFLTPPDNAYHDPDARVDVFRGDLAAMTEVSVWKPRPEPPPESEPAGETEHEAGAEQSRADQPEESAGLGVGPLVIAGLWGVALVSTGLVLVIARLRRRA